MPMLRQGAQGGIRAVLHRAMSLQYPHVPVQSRKKQQASFAQTSFVPKTAFLYEERSRQTAASSFFSAKQDVLLSLSASFIPATMSFSTLAKEHLPSRTSFSSSAQARGNEREPLIRRLFTCQTALLACARAFQSTPVPFLADSILCLYGASSFSSRLHSSVTCIAPA